MTAAAGAGLGAEERAHQAVDFIKRLVDAWDCCGTCAGGVVATHDAEVRREALAAADRDAGLRMILRHLEPVVALDCNGCFDYNHPCGDPVHAVKQDVREALRAALDAEVGS